MKYNIEDINALAKARHDIRIHMTLEDYGDGSHQKCMLMLPLVGLQFNANWVNENYCLFSENFNEFEIVRKKCFFGLIKAIDTRHPAIIEFDKFFNIKSPTYKDFFDYEYRSGFIFRYPVFIAKSFEDPYNFHQYSTELAFQVYGLIRYYQRKHYDKELRFNISELLDFKGGFMSFSEPGAEHKRLLRSVMPLLAINSDILYDNLKNLINDIKVIQGYLRNEHNKHRILTVIHLYNECWEHLLSFNHNMFFIKSLSFLEGYFSAKKMSQLPFIIHNEVNIDGYSKEQLKKQLFSAIEKRKNASHDKLARNLSLSKNWYISFDEIIGDNCEILTILNILEWCIDKERSTYL